MNFYIFLSLATFLISLLGTRLTILARRKRFKPTLAMLRGKEAPPIPGGGGIVVVFALAIALLMADVDYSVVLALFLLAAVSLLDELIGVAAFTKFIVQLTAVIITLAAMHDDLWHDWVPGWPEKIAIALSWVWFIRLFDRMDGINGLAATETVCIAGGICWLSVMAGEFPKALFSYSLVTATATVGFLWWNWHPAKIRLGELGRVPLGFICGYLLLLAAMRGHAFAAFILPAYVLADGLLAMLKRLPEGRYYRAAAKSGWTPDWVVRSIFGVNLLLVPLAILSELYPAIAGIILTVAYVAVFTLLGFFAHAKAKAAS